MGGFWEAIQGLWNDSGFARLFNFAEGGWKNLVMIAISCVLMYLAIKKQFEPLLLLPIAFGMLLVNLPLSGVMNSPTNSLVALSPEELQHFLAGQYDQNYPVFDMNGVYYWQHFETGGLLWYLYQGVKFGIYPPLIFLGIGCMTDFWSVNFQSQELFVGCGGSAGNFHYLFWCPCPFTDWYRGHLL